MNSNVRNKNKYILRWNATVYSANIFQNENFISFPNKVPVVNNDHQ